MSPKSLGSPRPGVFEWKQPLQGYRCFAIVNRQGETIRHCTGAERHVTERVIEAMWWWLDEVDPVVQLRAV